MTIELVSTDDWYKLSKPVFLIGIHGKAGAGKDTFAEMLQEYLNPETDIPIAPAYIHPFAHFLKDAAALATGMAVDWDVLTREEKEQKNSFWGFSPREFWQYFGTEMFRKFDPDFWIKRLAGHIEGKLESSGWASYDPGDVIIIPDVRFQNEADWIKDNGGHLVHIVRETIYGEPVGIPNHASEAGIDTQDCYTVLNNSTLEVLNDEVVVFANSINFNINP